MTPWPLLVAEALLLVGLMLLSAYFSSVETALFSLNAVQVQRLRSRHPAAGARISALLQQPTRILSTLLVGNTLANVAIASLGYTVIDGIPLLRAHSAVIAIPLMTLLLLILGEVAPKRLALSHAERLAPSYAVSLAFWVRVLAPLCGLLEGIARLFRPTLRPERRTLSDEELLTAVEVGAEQGALDEEERSMVDSIMRLSEMQAADVMTPRVDIVALDLDDPPEKHLALARATRHHFLPVYRHTPDAVEGFLDVTRYLLDTRHDARHAISAALFVPETAALDDLLITLQRSNRHVACVLDEFGGTAGIISLGDILELLTGEIRHGASSERPAMEQIDRSHWLIEGDTSLDVINHELDLELEADGADRIAGWVTAHAGRFLRPGEAVEAQGCRVEVRRQRRLRIEQVQLEVLPAGPADVDLEPPGTEDEF